jgi:hypothetical protein
VSRGCAEGGQGAAEEFSGKLRGWPQELDKVQVGTQNIALAAPRGHPLTKLKKLRLRDMVDASFIWFPRRKSPAFYDRLMRECFRGLKNTAHRSEAVMKRPS